MTVKNAQKYNISKEELHSLYVVQGKSSNEIAKMFGMKSHKTVTGYLKKYGIQIRGRSDALMTHHNGVEQQPPLTEVEKEIIIGELLGDGSVYLEKKTKGIPYYRHSSKYEFYLMWLSSILPSLKWKKPAKHTHRAKRVNGGEIISYFLRSRCHPDLSAIHERFYDTSGEKPIKHVPLDLELTPLMIRHWFIGDGSAGLYSVGRRNGMQRKAWQIYFSTCAFSDQEVDHLIEELAKYRIKGKKNRKGKNLFIRISAESHERFYEVIGECPVECYQYKWDRTAREI